MPEVSKERSGGLSRSPQLPRPSFGTAHGDDIKKGLKSVVSENINALDAPLQKRRGLRIATSRFLFIITSDLKLYVMFLRFNTAPNLQPPQNSDTEGVGQNLRGRRWGGKSLK